MNHFKNTFAILLGVSFALSLTGCFDEKEDLYDILGGVATISVWTPSKLNPTAGEAMTVNLRYYSEHAPVQELRFYAKVGADDRVLVETVQVTNHNVQNSYERVFNFTVPVATPASTVIVFTIEIETLNDLMNSRSTPATGTTGVVRVI